MSGPAEFGVIACKSCGARIFFARTETGGRMPLDAKPVRAMAISDLGPGETEHRLRWVETYRSHFETCPAAEKHRRKK